jgi:hypothetical protein
MMRWGLLFGLACVRCGGFAADAPCSVAPGGLVITELGVRGQSYVEVYGDVAADLATLSLSVAGSGAARSVPLSGRVVAGAYLTQPVKALADDGGSLTLACGSAVIDSVSYAAVKSDVVALDGDMAPDATANDDASLWCAQAGTPGGPNDPCNTCAGRAPEAGELLIVAVLANPKGADAGNEWVRVYVVADEEISFAGLTLVHSESTGTSRRWALDCQTGEPGDTVELHPDKLALYNADDTTLSLLSDDVIIDSAELPSLVKDGTVAVLDGLWCVADENAEELACD